MGKLVKPATQHPPRHAQRGPCRKARLPQQLVGMGSEVARLIGIGCRCHVVEALRTQEVGSPRSFVRSLQVHGLMQRGVGVVGSKGIVAATALRIQPVCHGHGLEERRLARAILAREERDVGGEGERQALERRDVPHVAVTLDGGPVYECLFYEMRLWHGPPLSVVSWGHSTSGVGQIRSVHDVVHSGKSKSAKKF